LTVNVTVVDPAGTVTKVGTVAEGSLLVKVTARPPAGAAEGSVIVPTEAAPPFTDAGASESLNEAAGLIVNAADFELPLLVAVMFAVAGTVTARVVTVNVTVD
jgi:hypothetical protein